MNSIELTEEGVDKIARKACSEGALTAGEVMELCRAAYHGVACKVIDPEAHRMAVDALEMAQAILAKVPQPALAKAYRTSAIKHVGDDPEGYIKRALAACRKGDPR